MNAFASCGTTSNNSNRPVAVLVIAVGVDVEGGSLLILLLVMLLFVEVVPAAVVVLAVLAVTEIDDFDSGCLDKNKPSKTASMIKNKTIPTTNNFL